MIEPDLCSSMRFTASRAQKNAPFRWISSMRVQPASLMCGVIDTPMSANVPAPILKGIIATTPMRRMGTADEIAAAALFLASDESSFVNASAFVVDGGITSAYVTPE